MARCSRGLGAVTAVFAAVLLAGRDGVCACADVIIKSRRDEAAELRTRGSIDVLAMEMMRKDSANGIGLAVERGIAILRMRLRRWFPACDTLS